MNIDRVPIKKDPLSDRIFRLTTISFFFGNYHVKLVERKEVYTFSDFLAICGGLLGLFLGISLLSIIEVVYFVTLRAFCGLNRSELTNSAESNGNTPNVPVDFMQAGRKLFKEFGRKCSIHGVQYFTHRKLHWIEK